MVTLLRVNARLLVQRLDKEMLVFDPDRDEVHLLNESATAIWEGVRDGLGPGQIAERLRQRYDLDTTPDAPTLILSVLRELVAKGILEPVQGPA